MDLEVTPSAAWDARHPGSPRWPQSDPRFGGRQAPESAEPEVPLRLVDPTTLEGMPLPPRAWIVEDWLPVGYASLLYGDGGTGKTLLAQQLMTSCATGRPWCDLPVTPCRAYGHFCEDDADELHRRQAAICTAYGVPLSALGDMRWSCGVGEDNLLVVFDLNGRMHLTDRYRAIEQDVVAFGARLVVIDTAADSFGGNEVDRSQVRRFVGHALGRLARLIGGAVLLNAHPSRSGMGSAGDMDGGSTGWSNSARSRWALVRAAAAEVGLGEEDERVLSRRKANYARRGDEIKLRWQGGVLVPVERQGSFLGHSDERVQASERFLTLLDRCTASNMPLSAFKGAGNWAPRVLAGRTDAHGLRRADFEQAMGRLLSEGAIVLESYGRRGDERRRIVRAATAAEALPR